MRDTQEKGGMMDLTKERGTVLMKGLQLVEEFRKFDQEMPMQMAAVFLIVATNPGITMKELERRLGTSQASVSRNVAALSQWHRMDKPGHDLVIAKEDPAERRRKIVFLTPKGMRVADSLLNILG